MHYICLRRYTIKVYLKFILLKKNYQHICLNVTDTNNNITWHANAVNKIEIFNQEKLCLCTQWGAGWRWVG